MNTEGAVPGSTEYVQVPSPAPAPPETVEIHGGSCSTPQLQRFDAAISTDPIPPLDPNVAASGVTENEQPAWLMRKGSSAILTVPVRGGFRKPGGSLFAA